MYFYYLPKGLLRKKPVNVYEVPKRFNINENEYLDEIKAFFNWIENNQMPKYTLEKDKYTLKLIDQIEKG